MFLTKLKFISSYRSKLAPVPAAAFSSKNSSIESMISAAQVVIFSKSYCPYCRRAKGILESREQPYKAYELDHMEEGQKIQYELYQKTKQRTVPNIFVGGVHLGGSDDLYDAARGTKLDEMLEKSKPKL